MGVALVLAPLMLFFLLAPLIYLISAFILAKIISKQCAPQTRTTVYLITLLAFSIYPIHMYMDYHKFSELCKISRPPITAAPIKNIESIAFVSEGGDFSHEAFLWHREMNLSLHAYEYAYIVDGKEVMRNLCEWGTHKCKYGGNISSRYMFLVTSAKKNKENIFQSNISVVDRKTGEVIYDAREYVFTGALAAYHGAFLAKPGHHGYLSCGYLGHEIDVWRPNDSNTSRIKYANTDTSILTTIFPSLKVQRNDL